MFVSYAQNFEDVMLDRVFAGQADGLYLDAGAWHPDQDSVTRHFYEKGWSGINVEPSRFYFSLLKRRRPRDINLNVALGRQAGEMEFFEVPGSAMSSLDHEAVGRAGRHGFGARQYRVPVRSLQSVCDEYCCGKSIAFLKIDVEGFEKEVIDSLDWHVHRPVVVLVEAVHPDTRAPAWASWEPVLLAADYAMVWFDGLNRYYLRKESLDLQKHFVLPPNLFDGFVLAQGHALSAGPALRFRRGLQKILPAMMYRLLVSAYRAMRRAYLAARQRPTPADR